MTTSLDTIRYHSGIAGEEVADMVDSLEREVSSLREQVEKLTKERDEWMLDACPKLAAQVTVANEKLAAAPTPPVSEDRKDAERYRWLRKEWFREDEENSWFMQSESSFLESPDEFDAAIDAAMEGK